LAELSERELAIQAERGFLFTVKYDSSEDNWLAVHRMLEFIKTRMIGYKVDFIYTDLSFHVMFKKVVEEE